MRTATMLQLPQLRHDQTRIAQSRHKIAVVAMGRRWGKTTMAGAMAISSAASGGVVAWVAPTYANSRPLWRFVERAIIQQPRIQARRSDRSVDFPGGGRLGIYTADNDIALRGEAFDLVIVDEAARVTESTYTDVLLPTLADRDGRLWLISTPRGRNWFWRQFIVGQDPANTITRSYTAPSSDNPLQTIKRAAELARGMVSDHTYRQEWLAEFVEDGGGVFRGVLQCVRDHATEPEPGKQYVMGVDWGRTNDATVFTVMCVEDAQVVCIESMQDTAYALQLDRLKRLHTRWQPYAILAEANSMGGPLVEALQRLELPVRSFVTTAITKPPLIDALALAIERGDIGLTNNTTLINELRAYESERLPSGAIRYSAPGGMHDDHVISIALAWRAVGRGGPMVLFEA